MDDEKVVTEQIRQLTLTDRLKFTGDGDVPALDTRLPDGAAGESGYSKARAGAGDEDLQPDARDESELEATDEHRLLVQAPGPLNSNSGPSIIRTDVLRQLLEAEPESRSEAQHTFDSTIPEVRPFIKRKLDDSG